jgi:hypothetical protein
MTSLLPTNLVVTPRAPAEVTDPSPSTAAHLPSAATGTTAFSALSTSTASAAAPVSSAKQPQRDRPARDGGGTDPK